MYLVMLETNGNQRFVFESPRLRDAIGASYLVARLDQWVKEEFGKLAPAQSVSYEVACVSRSSGKVIVRVDEKEAAKSLISAVTRRVAAQAPGLDVTGVFIKTACDAVCGEDVQKVHEAAAQYAVSRPPAQARFAQMPFLVRGKDSALPASPRLAAFLPGQRLDDEANDDRTAELSLPSRVKRYYALDGRVQFLRDMGQLPAAEAAAQVQDGSGTSQGGIPQHSLTRDITKIEQQIRGLEAAFEGKNAPDTSTPADEGAHASRPGELSRVAIIHVDGNGVGALMRNLQEKLNDLGKTHDIDQMLAAQQGINGQKDTFARFVKAINQALEEAMREACRQGYLEVARLQYPNTVVEDLKDNELIYVVPVLLGGDDLTVIADGTYALPFTVTVLKAFEELTAADPLLSAVAEGGRFTAGAGIAIVPTKFPFHLAYDLAERVAAQAKRIGKDKSVSTLAYHQLVDTTILDPAALLEHYQAVSCQAFAIQGTRPPMASFSDKGGQASDGQEPAEQPRGNDWQGREITMTAPAPAVVDWEHMAFKTAVFAGVCAPDGTPGGTAFPGTRAQRMRGYAALIAAGLNDVDHGLSIDRAWKDTMLHEYVMRLRPPEQPESEIHDLIPSQLLAGEWASASSQSNGFAAACKVIEHPHFFFDLINLKELLPRQYLQECGRNWPGERPIADRNQADVQGGTR